jgi:hypothetical protein
MPGTTCLSSGVLYLAFLVGRLVGMYAQGPSEG